MFRREDIKYVSPIDEFLKTFTRERYQLTKSEEREINKHREIFKKSPNSSPLIWKNF